MYNHKHSEPILSYLNRVFNRTAKVGIPSHQSWQSPKAAAKHRKMGASRYLYEGEDKIYGDSP